jgi:hypothetical protein
MPATGTSGLMSEEGKRSAHAIPRHSSTLLPAATANQASLWTLEAPVTSFDLLTLNLQQRSLGVNCRPDRVSFGHARNAINCGRAMVVVKIGPSFDI